MPLNRVTEKCQTENLAKTAGSQTFSLGLGISYFLINERIDRQLKKRSYL